MTVTAHEVAKGIEENKEKWLEGQTDPLLQVPHIEHVHLHGKWLEEKLREEGATEAQVHDACFSLGQRLCESLPGHYSQVTAEVWNKWKQGYIDKPGLELAKQLIKENS